jgi:uncharacterized protein (DUF1499 family)
MKRTPLLKLCVVAIALTAVGCAGPVPGTLGVQAETGALVACPDSPNCVSSRADDAVHGVDAFQIAGDVAAGWTSIAEGVAAVPGVRVITQTDRYLHAESTSLLMRYVDDLELVLDPATGRVDVRSASRVGVGDMGVNFARVTTLRTLLTNKGVLAE